MARFFTEHRQVALVLLLATFVWGFFGYQNMPKRKDPNIPVRVASAQCPWPGATAEQVEQLVTRPIEQAIALNSTLKPPSPSDFGIRSLSFPGLSVVYIQLDDNVKDKEKQFSDMNLKLNQLNLPRGAGPIQFNSNFGDTAALMLTVASPMVDSDGSRAALHRDSESHRANARAAGEERSAAARERDLCVSAVGGAGTGANRLSRTSLASAARKQYAQRPALLRGPGYVGLDASTTLDDATIRARGEQLIQANLHRSEIHPDAWQPAIIRDPADTEASACKGRRREVFLSRSRQLHRPDSAHPARRSRDLEGLTLGRAAGADLPRLLAAAAGAVRVRSVEAEGRSGRAEHHAARRLAGSRARKT